MNGAFRLRILCVLVFCLCAAGAVFAQETARWLADSEEAGPYSAIFPRLNAYAESVVAAGVNERLYLDRLKEGIRKRAPAERIAQAMEDEASRLVFMAKELAASGIRTTAEARDRALSDCALFLRAAVSREEFAVIVKTAAAKVFPLERVSAAVSALASADPARVVESSLRLDLAAALAGSDIKTDRLDSIAAVFSRGRSFALSPDRIARIVVAELASGGGFAAMDARLNRERTRR